MQTVRTKTLSKFAIKRRQQRADALKAKAFKERFARVDVTVGAILRESALRHRAAGQAARAADGSIPDAGAQEQLAGLARNAPHPHASE